MYVLKITDDYDKFTKCTDNEIEDIIITIKHLLLSIPSSVILLCNNNLKNFDNSKNFIA